MGCPFFAHSAPVLSFLGKPVVARVNDLIQFLLSIMGGIFVFVVAYSGVRYVFSASDPQGQTNSKKTFTGAIWGLIIVFVSYAFLVFLDRIFVK